MSRPGFMDDWCKDTSCKVIHRFADGDCVYAVEPATPAVSAPDTVNWPPHYRSTAPAFLKDGTVIEAGKLEALDVIEAFDLNPHMANVIKYALRAGRKGPSREDLEKARMYLGRAIKRAEQLASLAK